LSGVGGELSFDQAGKFVQAKLNAEEASSRWILTPRRTTSCRCNYRAWQCVAFAAELGFDDLTAKGELANDELVITGLDGRIMGGMLLGDARINWSSAGRPGDTGS